MRRLFSILPVALVAAACGPGSPKSSDAASLKSVSAHVYTVMAADAPVYYEATGTARARLNAVLSSRVMARVVTVSAREGDAVRSGQRLVSLDSRDLSAAVDVARANLSASSVGVDSAQTVREMEVKTSLARIGQAQAAVAQSRAALNAAQSKLDLALAGPRVQEKAQAHLAVQQAESQRQLAKIQLDRISLLVTQGAMARKDLDVAQSAFDVATAQRDFAVQAEKIAQEGTRSEDLRGAHEGVSMARASVRQAEANLAQANAASLQTRVRGQEIRSAKAQVSQSAAALRSAEVTLGFSTVSAPFDGWIVQRAVDPGATATPGSPLLVIEGGELRLEAIVPESVLDHITVGTTARVAFDALAESGIQADVSEIVPAGDPATHTFIVKLVLPRKQGLKSGMFGRARFPIGRRSQIEVPSGSIWERQGLHYVIAVNGEGIARLRIVTVGDLDGDSAVVLSGLSAGDRIVVGDRNGVVDGVKVVSR